MNEIEEFLKRAAAMRARQQPTQQPPAQRQPNPLPPAPRPLVSQPPATPLRRLQVDDVLDAEVVEADESRRGNVADYVARHLDAGQFRERTSHLGESVKSTDEVLEAHLHQTFEHRLGQLGASTSRADDSTLDEDENAAAAAAAVHQPQAIDLRALLLSPQNLRHAIILSEILSPPYERW